MVVVASVNSNKKVVVFSLLAITLALLLGIVSFGFFAEMPPTTHAETVLDVYTQKAGLGVNASGGHFEPLDVAFLYAYLTRAGIGVSNTSVTFSVRPPDAPETLRTVSTNGSGIAYTTLSFLPSEGHVIGTWNILANTSTDSERVIDTLDLQVRSQQANISVLAKKNGEPSTMFLPNDTVLVEAQTSYRDLSVNGTTVTFNVKSPNGTVVLTQPTQTDTLGIASISFGIPWPSDSSLGIWQLSAECEIYEQRVNATSTFECQLLAPVIDVFTQKGGYGPNVSGGTFAPNETVVLTVEIRDELNRTLPYMLVSFQVKDPANVSAYRTQWTNASGAASITYRIPENSNDGETFEVYVAAQYNGTVLLDTLTFITKTV